MPKCNVIPFTHTFGVCDRCGKTLVGRQRRWCSTRCSLQYSTQHMWTMARQAALIRDGRQCTVKGCTVRVGLEVNHIKRRNGRGYGFGCWNHLTNLETLCHAHHLVVTARQRAERKAATDVRKKARARAGAKRPR